MSWSVFPWRRGLHAVKPLCTAAVRWRRGLHAVKPLCTAAVRWRRGLHAVKPLCTAAVRWRRGLHAVKPLCTAAVRCSCGSHHMNQRGVEHCGHLQQELQPQLAQLDCKNISPPTVMPPLPYSMLAIQLQSGNSLSHYGTVCANAVFLPRVSIPSLLGETNHDMECSSHDIECSSDDVECSSVMKKRRRKMNRHKYKKWRKKMLFLRRRLGK